MHREQRDKSVRNLKGKSTASSFQISYAGYNKAETKQFQSNIM
ncbi:hypothetical protein [Paenibacillus agilis]|nr:hypothetical protein [Paenibacillus agilis]